MDVNDVISRSKDIRRLYTMSFQLTQDEREELESVCQELDLPMSKLLRGLVLTFFDEYRKAGG